MTGFMISTDYAAESGAFDHPVVVLDMYKDVEHILNRITNESKLFVTQCNKDHPLVVCLSLGKWTSYKTIQRLYIILSLFRDSIKDNYDINVVVDFTADSAVTLSRFNLLGDFEILSGSSIEVKEEYHEK